MQMRPFTWPVVLIAAVLVFWSTPASALQRPNLTIPFIADDSWLIGISGAILTTFLAEACNQDPTRFPFDVNINIRFTYTGGPEIFYDTNRLGKTKPPMLLGSTGSSATQLISTIGDVYDIPIMVYWATSPYLSSKDEYPKVWRTTSSDAIRMKVWVDLCVFFQWAHVLVIDESGSYGQGATEAFDLAASAKGISVKRLNIASEQEIESAMLKILAQPIRIIVAPLSAYLTPVMEMAVKHKVIGPEKGFVWLFGDAAFNLFGSTAGTYRSEYWGSMTTLESNKPLVDKYNTTQYHPLIDVAYKKVKAAYDAVNMSSPFRNNSLVPPRASMETGKEWIWTPGPYPLASVRALFVLLEAAKDFYYANNGTMIDHSQVSDALRSFSKPIMGATVSFDAQQEYKAGDVGVVNFRSSGPINIAASWNPNDGLRMVAGERFIWPDGTTNIPDDGVAKENFIVMRSAGGILYFILALAQIALYLFTIGCVLKFSNTPVFRLASPYSLIIILIGLVLFTSGALFYVARPNTALCQLRYWTYYVGLSLCYSALIAKTWRVWMVFKEASSLRKMVITNRRLMVYTLLLSVPAVFLCILRATISEDTMARVLSKDKTRVDVVCYSKSAYWASIQTGWAGLQMLLALILSWLTRTVPSGFNESKHVFITVYAAATSGLIGVITSFAVTGTNPILSIHFTVLSTFVCTGVMWSMLFIPKLYIAIIKPELNTVDLLRKARPAEEKRQYEDGYMTKDAMQVPLMEENS